MTVTVRRAAGAAVGAATSPLRRCRASGALSAGAAGTEGARLSLRGTGRPRGRRKEERGGHEVSGGSGARRGGCCGGGRRGAHQQGDCAGGGAGDGRDRTPCAIARPRAAALRWEVAHLIPLPGHLASTVPRASVRSTRPTFNCRSATSHAAAAATAASVTVTPAATSRCNTP